MNKSLTSEELEMIWKKQMTTLDSRQPKWILSSLLLPVVFIVLQSLILFPMKQRLIGALITSSIAYFAYLLFAMGIYTYLRAVENKRKRSTMNSCLAAWLYGAYDMCSLALASIFLLGIGLLSLETAGFSLGILGIMEISVLIIYILAVLLILVFTPSLLRRKHKSLEPGLPLETKWAIAIPTFLTVFGVIVGRMLSHNDEFKIGVIILAGLFLIGSFVLASICAQGLAIFIYLAWKGIPRKQYTQYSVK